MTECHLSDAELARKTGISQPRITNLRNGRVKNPSIDTLISLANYFYISISQLVGEIPISSLPTTPNTSQKYLLAPMLDNYQDIKAFIKNPDYFPKRIPLYKPSNQAVFSFLLREKMMEPRFPQYSHLIFSPNRVAIDGDYVLIYFSNIKLLLFRQLLIDGENKYAINVNPKCSQTRQLTTKDKILGVLVETHFIFE